MLNSGEPVTNSMLGLIDYADEKVAKALSEGAMNVSDEQILANIKSSIRRGYPQMRNGPARYETVCLVGGGPSLNETEDELRELLWKRADRNITLVALNGAYKWCIDRGLRPDTHIVMDARPFNARFVNPEVPHCNYVIASQCAPEIWDAVEGRPNVWIWHPVVRKEHEVVEILDNYYGRRWIGIPGGVSVATRALNMLRMCGYLRFHLFGIDCCYKQTEHHAYAQPENDNEPRSTVFLSVKGNPEQIAFNVAAWHIKQFEDFMVICQLNGKQWLLDIHGKGMLATYFRLANLAGEDVQFTPEGTDGSTGMESLQQGDPEVGGGNDRPSGSGEDRPGGIGVELRDEHAVAVRVDH